MAPERACSRVEGLAVEGSGGAAHSRRDADATAGERAGKYDAGLGTALFCVAGMLLFVGLTWNTALILERLQAARSKAESTRARLFEGRLLGMVIGSWRSSAIAGTRCGKGCSPRWGSRPPSSSCATSGPCRRGVSFVLDLHEQKRMEDDLRRSDLRFRATFELAAVGLAHVSSDGHWRQLNQRYCDILGYTQQELMGLSFRDVTYPADLEVGLEQHQRLVAGELPSYSLEKRYVRKDGRTIWGLLTASVVRTSG